MSLLVQPLEPNVKSDVEGIETFILMPFILSLSDISIYASPSAQPALYPLMYSWRHI
jgi:hypothetical protein